MEEVRAEPGERLALLDAEPVLLVDDGHGEIGERDAALDQCVRPDDDLGRARFDLGAGPLRAGAPRQEQRADAEARTEGLDRHEVLLRKGLGGNHERALGSGLDRTHERIEGDDGLPGADVSLEEPLHRNGLGEIAVDLRDRPLLMLGQLEGKLGPVPGDERPRRRQRSRKGVFLAATAGNRDLEAEQLIEREPPASLLGLVQIGREVHGGEGVAANRMLELRRQRVDHIGCARRERRAGKLPEPGGGNLLACAVHGREVGRRACLAEIVRAHLESMTAEPAPQPKRGPGDELLRQPRLVEPAGRDRTGRIGDLRGDDREAAARPPNACPPHDAGDRHLLVAPELRDRDLVGRAFVAPRPAVEQIADRDDTERREALRQGGPDAGQRVDREREPLGAGPSTRARPVTVGRQPAEAVVAGRLDAARSAAGWVLCGGHRHHPRGV